MPRVGREKKRERIREPPSGPKSTEGQITETESVYLIRLDSSEELRSHCEELLYLLLLGKDILCYFAANYLS